MITTIKTFSESGNKHADSEGGRLQTHVILNKQLQDKLLKGQNKDGQLYAYTNISFCSNNPELRPSICSVLTCIFIQIVGIIILLASSDSNLYILGTILLVGAGVANVLSIICFCIKRQSIAKYLAEQSTVDGRGITTDIRNDLSDQMMQRAVIQIKFRACDDARPPTAANDNKVATRVLTPVHRYQYEILQP
ncbi:unnamed protein product [Clavelina lepadiformis]|uniref:Uncharacterized protein n=1 Tax=Clavelina lepadiformis TaxID=159417 RepID=A0ABP0G245_CLALP